MLTQRLYFRGKEKIETMDRLDIIQGQNIIEQLLDFPVEEKIETMESLTITQGQKIVETTVGFSRNRKD